MAKNERSPEPDQPIWFDGKNINEALFCDEFLRKHKIIYTNRAFFTPEGRVTDELALRSEIFEELRCCAVTNIPRKIGNILELMKLVALVEDFPPEKDKVHLSNGTLLLDGTFIEGKGKQSYQGWMFARLLAFSNGDLMALFDRSEGFYRRQLILTTKEKPADRTDDPGLAEKMKAEAEGIFLWAFEGLQRLVANNFKFTESDRIRENREAVKRDNNNVYEFIESGEYVCLKADASASSKELYESYQLYCTENNLPTLKPRSFSDALIACKKRYNLEYCNNVTNSAGRRVRGFLGIRVLVRSNMAAFSCDSVRTYVRSAPP